MSDILEILFGFKSRARIIRFFVLNPGQRYSARTISEKALLPKNSFRSDLNALEKIQLIKSEKIKNKKLYILNEDFLYYPELKNLFMKANIYPYCSEVKKIGTLGKVKLVVISGIFLNYEKAGLDLLIVGDELSKDRVTEYVQSIEAEIAREIRYMQLTLDEFEYRLEMMDRFLIEFLTNQQVTIIDKIPKLNSFLAGLKD